MRLAVLEPSMFGGLLHYAVQLADGLAGRGHDVDVLAPRGNELAGRTGAARMRAVLMPPIRDVRQPESLPAIVARQAEVGLRVTAEWARATWEVRRGGYDAVVITGDTSLLPATIGGLAITAGRRGPAVAGVCHNVRIYNRYRGDELFAATQGSQRLLGRLMSSYDVVFVHGERSRQEYEEHWPPARLAVIPHGDERIFGDPPPPAAEERVLFFGDWRKVKGLPVLMEAFDLLAARRPTVRLTIAGTPAPADLDPEPVRAWAESHGERVEVIDRYVPVEDVRDVFARARVVVTPYFVGYQSGVIHLAMSMARAVVTSDVGDLSAAVRDGETGLVVPPDDPAALADALERVVSDPALADRLGAGGHERVRETASWDVVAEKVEAALLDLPPRRGRGA
ncbi:MAG TPA: glycosyltransferase family 4 protein [Solirubrobacteraceae bacterium]|nr:glycosyltransferase family 4 protein [Solirubrobacteraceae bacterium]